MNACGACMHLCTLALSPPMPNKRVLVVEDDGPTQSLLQALLRRDGYHSTIVSNGGHAIKLLRDQDFDLIVLDLMMPLVSGVTVIESLRDQGRKIPVVVCTAAPMMMGGFEPGLVSAFIRKPFDIDELSAAV